MTNTRAANRVSAPDLQQRIDRVYDHLYANASTRTPSGIASEVGKFLHTAMYVEEQNRGLFSEIESGRRPAFKFTAAEVRKLIRDELFQTRIARRVRHLFTEMNESWCLYDPDESIVLSDFDIAYICSQLDGIIVSDRDRDVFGDALEIFRSQWAKRAGGQFFTDQRVTSLAIKLLDFDPRRGDDLVDLCAGTGGFLLAGLNRIRELLESDQDSPYSEHRLVELASSSLRGQEVDREVCEIANATLGARVSAARHIFVDVVDSLRLSESSDVYQGKIQCDTHICAATNPPFGTKITIKDRRILQHYELAQMTGATNGGYDRVSPRAPDVLFIERNVRILKPGVGRLGIVVPYQILSGPQSLFVRKWLIRNTQILAVIDLPANTFQPHTGTKTALIVVRRRVHPLTDVQDAKDGAVFMSMPRWIGHDRRGNPVYRHTADGIATREILSDFEAVERAFQHYKQGLGPSEAHAQSFEIDMAQVLCDPLLRLNALFYNPGQSRISHHTSRSHHTGAWRYVKIRDVVSCITYPTRFKRNYVDYYPQAVPFLGGTNISQLLVNPSKWLRHDDPKLDELIVHAGWILVTRSGSTGVISTVPQAWDGYAMSEHIIRIIPNWEKLDPAYIQIFLRTKYAQDKLSRGVFGSVIDEITPEYVGEMEMPVPVSPDLLKQIINEAKEAESARDIAISALVHATDDLNLRLTASQPHVFPDGAQESVP